MQPGLPNEACASPTRVLVVEDDARLRARFATVVASAAALGLAGQAGTLQDGLALLEQERPDLVLLDLGLPDGSGIRLIETIARALPGTEVLVISVMGDEASVLGAIEAGAAGYLLKDASDSGILCAIAEVLAGGAPLSPSIAVHLMRRLQRPTRIPPAADTALSPRETELLRLIAKGLSYDEVAEIMGLRYNTVASYAKALYRKLQVHSRAEAVFEAMQLGLLGVARVRE